jgi:hypothetical protein
MPLSKWIVPSLAVLSAIAGCNNHPSTAQNAPLQKDKSAAHTLNAPASSVAGTWCGMFKPVGEPWMVDKTTGVSIPVPANKITLFIDQMQNGQIFGYSVCAGNDRPFRGTYTEDGDTITATLNEPGDNKYDGTFVLTITKSPLSLTGKWTPVDATQPGREYTLTRKNFAYIPSEGKYESSSRLLTDEDVNNLYKDELRFMRNEIYARHGYSFKTREVREMFDKEDWYMPVSTDVRKKLTAIEQKNEKLIKQFEKYEDEHEEDFGR